MSKKKSKKTKPTNDSAKGPTQEDKTWGFLFLGIVLMILGGGFFLWALGAERPEIYLRPYKSVLLIYQLFGRWGMLLIFGGAGLVLTIWSIKNFAELNKKK